MDLVVRQDVISHEAAHAMVGAAVASAKAANKLVSAAVVDSSGNLVAFLRLPGVPAHSIAIARDKAYTAAAFRVPSAKLYDSVKDRQSSREGLTARDGLTMMGGGLPILVDGVVVGGIGVSGATSAEDAEFARAAIVSVGAQTTE